MVMRQYNRWIGASVSLLAEYRDKELTINLPDPIRRKVIHSSATKRLPTINQNTAARRSTSPFTTGPHQNSPLPSIRPRLPHHRADIPPPVLGSSRREGVFPLTVHSIAASAWRVGIGGGACETCKVRGCTGGSGAEEDDFEGGVGGDGRPGGGRGHFLFLWLVKDLLIPVAERTEWMTLESFLLAERVC